MMSFNQLTTRTKNIVFVLGLMVVAAIFRCYHLTQIPLMNDELSALHRLQFQSFLALISNGVIPDGHPAVVQVFLFYYTKIFGFSSWVIKLPFIIAGCASVGVAYHYFSNQFNKQTAALVAVLMLPSQFFIMHSQTARPYAFGLLLVLLAASAWEKCSKQFTYKKFAWLLLFSVLTASTHYLALLTLVIIVLVSCVFQPNNWKQAIWLALSGLLVYSPQAFIFLKQIQVGGVGTWLGKPSAYFIVDFWNYATNSSWAIMVLLFSGAVLTLFNLRYPNSDKKIIAMALVFVLTFGVEFCYSVWRNPVLQYPALLFAWPFALAFCVWGYSKYNTKIVIAVGLMLFSFQTYALLITRKHYQVFYKQSYQSCVNAIVQHTTPKTALFLNGNQPFYFDYYFNQTNNQPNYINTRIDSLSVPQYQTMLQNTLADTIVVAHAFDLPSIYFEWAKAYYPQVNFHQQQAFNELYVLCKKQDSTNTSNVFDTLTNATLYSKNVQLVVAQQPYKRLRLVAKANFASSAKPNNSVLIIKVFDMHQRMIAESAQPYFNNTKQLTIACLDVASTPNTRKLHVQAFVLNDKQQQLLIQNLTLEAQPGNSLIYGTVEAIPDSE